MPRALLGTSPTGTASESAINFLQLRGWLFQPLCTILMDSWVSPLISQFGDRTITKDSNYRMQSVIVKMGVEEEKERRNGPSLESDDKKKDLSPTEQGASAKQRESWVQAGENAGSPANLRFGT